MIGDFGSFGGLVYEDMEIQDADILLIEYLTTGTSE